MKVRKKGFSLSELLITISVVILTMAISIQIFVMLNHDQKTIISYMTLYIKGRHAIDTISKDCRIAIRVMDSFSGYTTATDCLILKVPSIDSSHNIVDIDKEFDYIIYRLFNNELWKIVIPAAASARAAQNKVFEKFTESFSVTANDTPLSDIPHKSLITHVTISMAISEAFRGKIYRVMPGTTVKLMNYEWEFVR